MSTFKIGDRIKVYDSTHAPQGDVYRVIEVTPHYEDRYRVQSVYYPEEKVFWVHEKQCRKLVPHRAANQ